MLLMLLSSVPSGRARIGLYDRESDGWRQIAFRVGWVRLVIAQATAKSIAYDS